jgi:antitoxin component of MazEF toxin-antitoxin module
MARRSNEGSLIATKVGKIRGREHEGDKAIVQISEKHARVGVIERDGTTLPATEELVDSADVIDVRKIQNVTTGQRRVVVLPADLCRRLGISEGTPLRLVEHESHFEVIPMRLVPATEVGPDTLESLLAGVTPENIHGESDTGPAAGQETW